MKKYILLLTLLISTIFCFKPNLRALEDNGVPYKTYTIDSDNHIVPTQDAYIPVKSLRSFQKSDGTTVSINNPQDSHYDIEKNELYICNTGTGEILIVSENLKTARSIGKGLLKKPMGIFLTKDYELYVCDYDLEKVFVFNQAGELLEEYGKPVHPLYGEESKFKPMKVVVDDRKTLYVIDGGNAYGIARITREKEFLGFFGANYIKAGLEYVIRFMFSTAEQKKKLYRQPIAPYNLTIDENGLINTITQGTEMEGSALKKLNISGNNLYAHEMVDSNGFEDVYVGPIGNIYVVNKWGYIYEYDRDGNLLFIFGGQDSSGLIPGLFATPSTITCDDQYQLFVADTKDNTIQVFIPTDFSNLVHEAIFYYQEGKYHQSKEPWQKVLKMNQMFDLANTGLASAYLFEQDYTNALKYFKLSNNKPGYSDSYLEIRNVWMLKNFSIIACIIAVGVGLYFILNKFHILDGPKGSVGQMVKRVKTQPYVREFGYLFKFIRHPLNSLYDIKYNRKVSVFTGIIFYFLFLLVILFSQMSSGFYFSSGDVEKVSLFQIIGTYLLPMFLFIGCNYLVCTIKDGEAKFKDVFIGTICSFTPVILFSPILTIFSNVLTANESFIISFGNIIIWGWSFILLFFMIKDMQNYETLETIKIILLTIFTMVLTVAAFYLIYVLSMQLYGFIKDVILEVLARG